MASHLLQFLSIQQQTYPDINTPSQLPLTPDFPYVPTTSHRLHKSLSACRTLYHQKEKAGEPTMAIFGLPSSQILGYGKSIGGGDQSDGFVLFSRFWNGLVWDAVWDCSLAERGV